MLAHYLTPFRIALLLGVLLSALRFAGCHYLELVDIRAVDYRLLQRGVQPASPEVVVVAVDDASLEKLGRWPWSRALVAQLLDRLVAADAAVVGFDIVQSEATVVHGLDLLRDRVEGVDDQTWAAIQQALARGSAEDEALARAVRASGRAVLGYFFEFQPSPEPETPPRVSTYNVVQNSHSGKGENRTPLAPRARGNIPELTDAAQEVGYFNFIPDPDGAYRRVPLVIRYADQMAVPLSLAMLRLYRPQEALAIRFADFGVETVRWGHTEIPVAEDGQLLINFRGPGETFRHVSAADVLAGQVPAETFRGKLVLVGVTAAALADVRVTAFDGVFPGVEIHANVLDNVLRQQFLLQPKWIVLVEIGTILLLTILLGIILHYARGVTGALVTVGLAAGYLGASQWIFLALGLPLSLVYPLLAIGLTYTAIAVQHYVVEEREKRKTRRALELYLSPSLAAMVSEQPAMLKLGGEKREHTVLFSDVRGFTTISERLSPETLVELLNSYLGEMTDIIFAHDGMLDKYIGDAIMAVWGAPLPQPDHAVRACRAALGMVGRLRELTPQWEQRGWPPLDIGIGLNTGPMVFGNMGSAQHLSLTVMGDNVNLGSRLEGLNKMYGTNIIVSESTLQAAPDIAVVRELDLVRVKGKLQPVRIYELIAPVEEAARWRPLVERFATGIEAYRAQRWDEARAIFTAIMAEHPEDGPAGLYIERCDEMAAHPPGPDWDGVTVMETK